MIRRPKNERRHIQREITAAQKEKKESVYNIGLLSFMSQSYAYACYEHE